MSQYGRWLQTSRELVYRSLRLTYKNEAEKSRENATQVNTAADTMYVYKSA